MELQGMSDEQYKKILDQITDIRWLIIRAGGIATKTVVENILMLRYGCSRGDAHTLLNCSENLNAQHIMMGRDGAQWLSKRAMPKLEDWPELMEL
jgi:hypothetical protein